MSEPTRQNTVRLEDLIGRRVYGADGRKLGRVYDFLAERKGDDLRVTTLLLGPRVWLSRFGWGAKQHGLQVRWEEIDRLSPDIRLRESGEGGS
jgi:sporulation protein YlmC with PRC-barrel domain